MQIDVSFDAWKALTALLKDEHDSYNDVIFRLLDHHTSTLNMEVARQADSPFDGILEIPGAYFKNVFLPDNTELRATYKGKTYFSDIKDCRWVDRESGTIRTSPSQAAYEITKSGINGWRFWMVKRPWDEEWQLLDGLRNQP